ncbi:MAG: hypothetical protein JWN44_6352 [Myxococcales bacterium]|nr:hypothetical protein [Myxococcales bacterium]
MREDPRQRALRQLTALLDSLVELEITTPGRSSQTWRRPRPTMPELQTWVCRHYRWLVGVLMLQMIAMVALLVAMCG